MTAGALDGVETRYVAVRQGGRTPVVLVALEDPAEPTITFLRELDAPDTTIEAALEQTRAAHAAGMASQRRGV
jgi:sugar/nucleoside kinase (ribokinase family)